LQLVPNLREKRVDFLIIFKRSEGWVDENGRGIKLQSPKLDGTVRRSSATCPCCGYTTNAESTRKQFLSRSGRANDARLIAVVLQKVGTSGVSFRVGTNEDMQRFKAAIERCATKEIKRRGPLTLVPDEPLPYLRSIFNIYLLGVDTWGKLFNGRQALALVTLVEKTRIATQELVDSVDKEFGQAVALFLAFAIDRCADYWSSLAVWSGEFVAHTFGRQALGIVWDYAEVNGFAGASGTYAGAIEWIYRVIQSLESDPVSSATVQCVTACKHPLPDDSAQAFVTDPPYYDAVPYADLSDFFYVWLKRSIGDSYPSLFEDATTPKQGEIIQLSERNPIYAKKTREYFESLMKEAMTEGRRVLEPEGIGIVVFAHKTTTGWETQIQAMIDAGWMVTASWPIDTERPGRLRANNSAALASSVHLVCRPRENPGGSVRDDEVGDWRDVLQELPRRIHEWMPRLVEEGIVGADAIFACLGPALEVFSRFSRVEKASGETVLLREYLEHVWATVAKEALAMIFAGADTIGFEEDARLTAMWLWTLNSGNIDAGNGDSADESETDDEESGAGKKAKTAGFVLEYDAARKIAQGLGAHLEDLTSLVEVSGDQARLLPVGERARSLFGKDQSNVAATKKKKKGVELDLFKLAQALSALYPKHTMEKRWVDGVLARKKGLGF
jgi:putative DNA methylase